MRSADLSGAGAMGFGAGNGMTNDYRRDGRGKGFDLFSTLRLKLSPITTAVALTAVLAATLFVVSDTIRTLEDERRQTALADHLVSSSEAPITAADQAAISGIVQRGMGAFGLAALAIALTWRRRRADMSALFQRDNYQALAAALPMGIACWTQAGKLIVCNERYSERISRFDADLTYHDAVKQMIVGGSMQLIEEDEQHRLIELHRADGACLLIDERPLAEGGFMTLVSDITERKRVDTMLTTIREEQRLLARRYHEEKLRAEAASRAKTNFLAHLSHDIRTPLNHIIGFAELMRHQTYGPLGDARYGEYVLSIKESGEHLLSSFATILDLAELEGGQKVLRSDPVPVDDLIDSVAMRFKAQAHRAGLRLTVGGRTGAVLNGDKLGLQRMLGNIVENAVRFTPAGGKVTIAAFAARDGAVIEVTDTGLGMSEERLGSLSQPFALGDASLAGDGIGAGLGIPIARAIAELSGGNLAIDSSPALGTTVAISLPLAAEIKLAVAA